MSVVAILDYVSQRLSRKNLTFTVGREMYSEYRRRAGQVHNIAVSLVSERDIEDTFRDRMINEGTSVDSARAMVMRRLGNRR